MHFNSFRQPKRKTSTRHDLQMQTQQSSVASELESVTSHPYSRILSNRMNQQGQFLREGSIGMSQELTHLSGFDMLDSAPRK